MADNQIGFKWLYALVVLFVLGIIELIILPAIEGKLVPPLLISANQTLNASDVVAYTAQVADVIRFIDITMYTLMFAVTVFMIISIFRKETQYDTQY
jgi:hypothetical protein